MPVLTVDTITVGTKFSIEHPIEKYRAEGAGEVEFLKHFMSLLRKDDIFFDVGASIGAWSVYCAPLCNKVYSFEPDPGLFQALSENIEVNHLKNVCLLQYAVSDHDHDLEIFTSGRGGISPSVVKRSELARKIHVKSVSLDSLVETVEVPQPSVLKIDIEGAEYHALLGARKILKKVRLVCIELHPRQLELLGQSQESVLAQMDEFKVISKIECANEWNGDHLIFSRVEKPSSDRTKDKNTFGEELFGSGRHEEALSVFKEIVEKEPDNGRAHNNMGVVYFQMGRLEESVFHYRKAVELSPNDAVYKKNLADVLCVALGDLRGAMKIYNQILATDPLDSEALIAVGVICESIGRLADAKAFFLRVLEIDPQNVLARERLSSL